MDPTPGFLGYTAAVVDCCIRQVAALFLAMLAHHWISSLKIYDAVLCSDGPLVSSARQPSIAPSLADVRAVQRHLVSLSEHIRRLEVENSRRWRREMLLYPLIFGFVVVRLARWIISTKWQVKNVSLSLS